ncbi:hypothetical protein [Rhodopila sp.]|jgi:hypothetical protein|uniref:hypothetical protein n=1 Tax=Rhodopila sp. TaxID=2480087 RepID=UPI002CDD6AA9|nr:hypothetical protein [Rhodopila sp.]HVZ10641.1 hypothetical protein [Rhodopila sp.]
MANHYRLSGHGIDVEYMIGGSPSVPALRLTENGVTHTYFPPDIVIDLTDLGTIISVTLAEPTGARFGFFLPSVNVAAGQRVPVTTSGVIQTFSGPTSMPQRPASWTCVPLQGTAAQMVVPMRSAVAA